MKGLAGKTAIVTGASRGIGFGVAQRLVEEGARVVITARKPEPLAEAVAALGGPDVALGSPATPATPSTGARWWRRRSRRSAASTCS